MEHGLTMEVSTANRNYKDTVFRMLFSDKENLLSLYNAVAGRNYKEADQLKIVTLENAVYMGMVNDVAFLVDMGLQLYEHQSTYNPNIPLRNLFYISSEYQILVKDRSIYSSAVQRIPAPKFFVFYNGTEDMEDCRELRLSDAYLTSQDAPDLELKVTMLNVNAGHNRELMEQCRTLREYSQYVERVRKYAAQMELNEAVELAITECIREGILSDFLSRNRAEVLKVSIFEYDQELEEKKLREAEFEYGRETGIQEGRSEGLSEGLIAGKVESLLTALRLKGEVSEARQQEISEEKDIERLNEWFLCALSSASVKEFSEACGLKC